MTLELVPAQPQHIEEIARIGFEAFRGIHDQHSFPRDFPDIEIARQVIGMLVQRDDFYGVVALLDGQPVGSNFLSLMDAIAGVGPITIDSACQGQRIGRALMRDVMDYARRHNIEQVRLQQDAFNVGSLSLYASLGFNVITPTAFMQAAPPATSGNDASDGSVRPVTEADLPAIEELGKRIYKVSRRNEVAAAAPYGFAAFVCEREGRITGYLLPGIFGHGVAESVEDALALVGEAAQRLPAPFARFFCPLCEADFFRQALQAGCRVIKVMNYMALEPYAAPNGVWMPSVLC